MEKTMIYNKIETAAISRRKVLFGNFFSNFIYLVILFYVCFPVFSRLSTVNTYGLCNWGKNTFFFFFLFERVLQAGEGQRERQS